MGEQGLNIELSKRWIYICEGMDLSGKGIEIAPFYNPILPKKEGYDVETIDVFDRQQLIEIYKKGIKDGEWKYKTEIFRGTHKDIVDESIEYDFAVIGRLDFSYKNRPQIRTISKNAVLYRKHK